MPILISKKTQRVIWLLVFGAATLLFLQWAIPALLAFGVVKFLTECLALIIFTAIIVGLGTVAVTLFMVLLLYFYWLFNDKR